MPVFFLLYKSGFSSLFLLFLLQTTSYLMSHLEITKETDHNGFRLTIRPDGIMQISLQSNYKLTLADAEAMVKLFGEMGNGKKFLLLFLPGADTSVATEARYYASGQEANKYTIASAFVVKTIAQKLLGNAYVTFNKPITPTRIFTDETEAVKWLKAIG